MNDAANKERRDFDVKPPSDGKENPQGGCMGDAMLLLAAAIVFAFVSSTTRRAPRD